MAEKITTTPGFDANGEINCNCGNHPNADSFDHCAADGTPMDPIIGSGWLGHYCCARCGKVWQQPEEEGS